MGGHVKYSGGQGKLAKAAAAASSGSQSVSAIGQVQILKSKYLKGRIEGTCPSVGTLAWEKSALKP